MPPKLAPSHYDLLGVTQSANADELKKAYKKAALRHHPDKGGDAEVFKNVAVAYDILSDDVKRMAYDRGLLINDRFDPQQQSAPKKGSFSQQGMKFPPQPPTGQAPNRTRPGFGAGRPKAESTSSTGVFLVPPDITERSVRELKELLASWQTRHDDCFEKSELIERVRQAAAMSQAQHQHREREQQNYNASNAGGSGTDSMSQNRSAKPGSSNWDQNKYAAMTGPAPTLASADGTAAPPMRIKIISLGPSNSGKSCLIKRFCEGRFVPRYISTIGVDYGVKAVNISIPATKSLEGTYFSHTEQRAKNHSMPMPKEVTQRIKVNFFDLSGHDGFKDIRVPFYEHAQGALLCYDVTNAESFRKLRDNWLWEARSHGLNFSNSTLILCGNKVDLPNRQVSHKEGAQFALENGFTYFEISSSTGDNIVQAFNHLFSKILLGIRKQKQDFVSSMGVGGVGG